MPFWPRVRLYLRAPSRPIPNVSSVANRRSSDRLQRSGSTRWRRPPWRSLAPLIAEPSCLNFVDTFRSAAAAADALYIAVLQYKEGTTDFTTVLLAEQNLLQAQDNLAVAQGSVPLGLIATYRAMGGGWQLREGHDFVPTAVREEMAKRTYWGKLLSPE